jgi:ketosteroid isomerase-like protein
MNRRRYLAVAVCSVFVGACAAKPNPAVDTAAEEQAVRARSAEVLAAENAHDYDKATTYYTEDAVVQPADMPPVRGRTAVRALYAEFDKMGFPKIEGTTDRLTVAQSGDVAYEVGTNKLSWTTPTGPVVQMGKYLVVWKKVEGSWYGDALSFSNDTPPAPQPAAAPAKK